MGGFDGKSPRNTVGLIECSNPMCIRNASVIHPFSLYCVVNGDAKRVLKGVSPRDMNQRGLQAGILPPCISARVSLPHTDFTALLQRSNLLETSPE